MTAPLTPAADVAAAELRAQRARDQLQLTLGLLQNRLDPRARVEKAKRDARIASETAVAIARDKPAATGGAIAGVALALGVFLGRHRIARLFARPRRDASSPTAGLNPVTRTRP